MAGHGEGHANQQDDRHLKEQRQRTDQTGQTNRIVRPAVAEGFQHFDGDLIDRASFMQDLAKHRAQCDDNRQEAQRASHPLFHGRGDFVERHSRKETCTNRNHHQGNEGVHAGLHYQKQQQQHGADCC